MKLDIVRAWKDEGYREGLEEQELSTLPANPSGEIELSDAALESIYGGGIGVGVSSGSSRGEHIHSYSVICDISLFSINVKVLNIISIATSTTQVCVNND